jgi:hypothetical protein
MVNIDNIDGLGYNGGMQYMVIITNYERSVYGHGESFRGPGRENSNGILKKEGV